MPNIASTMWIAFVLSCTLSGIACQDDADLDPDGQPVAGQDAPSADQYGEDASPELPPVPEGAVRVQLAERMIEAGTEKQFCHYLDPLEADKFMVTFTAHQGKGGHHLLMFRTLVKEEPGTIKDCTAAESMTTILPAVFSAEFGTGRFPPGMAVRLPAGEQLVVQQHYVNTSDDDILVSDAVDLFYIDESEVDTELGFYALTDVSFSLEPTPEAEVVSIECEVPRDMSLLMAGPHMHEQGARYRAAVRSASGTNVMVDIPQWDPEFRDLPPVADFTEAPVALRAGDTIEIQCTFENGTGGRLGFPAEMCALYGYYYPVGDNPTWICSR